MKARDNITEIKVGQIWKLTHMGTYEAQVVELNEDDGCVIVLVPKNTSCSSPYDDVRDKLVLSLPRCQTLQHQLGYYGKSYFTKLISETGW